MNPLQDPLRAPLQDAMLSGRGSAETLLEGFETFSGNVPTGGAFTWNANGVDYTLVSSALHVTQGAYSGKLVSTSSGAIILGPSYGAYAPVDLSAYNTLKLDVYVESIDTGGSVSLTIDDGLSGSDSALTPADGLGAYTLEVDVSLLGDKTNTSIYIGIDGANIGTFYLDNLRGS